MSESLADPIGVSGAAAGRRDAVTRGTLSGVKRVLGDPFMHFIVLGALIYLAARLVSSDTEPTQINVDPQRLAQTYEQQYGRAPAAADLRALVDRYVREEIYFREGLALGLQTDDEIVRRRVVQKYEFLQQDNALIAEPDQAALHAYFDKHAAAYLAKARVSFTHVYFESNGSDDNAVLARAEQVKTRLRNSDVERAPQSGDRFPELYDYSELGPDELSRLFGRYPIAADLLQAPVGAWSGPYRSGYGWHLVRVSHRQAAQVPDFDEVRERVRDDFVAAERQTRANELLGTLRRKYVIHVAAQP